MRTPVKHSCGIDFGTSNSSVALSLEGKIELVPLEDLQVTIPSALFFPVQQMPVFGRQAVRCFFQRQQGRFMRSLKRVLGTTLMKQGTLVNNKAMKFELIIGSFLKFLREKSNEHAGGEIYDVVLGRPVHFIDNNPDADALAQEELRSIAISVGFKNVEFQFEPIAAAFAHEINLSAESLAIVVDLGGGTSDFTIIRLSNKYITKTDRSSDILASSGVRIGGNDFDKELCLQLLMPELGYRSTYGAKHLEVPLKYFHDLAEWSKVNFLYTPKTVSHVRQLLHQSDDPNRLRRLLRVLETETGHSLLSAGEQAKIALTMSDHASADLSFLQSHLEVQLTRGEFERVIEEDVSCICDSAQDCLRSAGLVANAIDLVILTGGSTEIPIIQKEFRRLFPSAAIADSNKMSSVGLGLAYDSMRRFR